MDSDQELDDVDTRGDSIPLPDSTAVQPAVPGSTLYERGHGEAEQNTGKLPLSTIAEDEEVRDSVVRDRQGSSRNAPLADEHGRAEEGKAVTVKQKEVATTKKRKEP